MKRAGTAVVLGSVLIAAIALAGDPPLKPKDPLAEMAWLAGTWERNMTGGTFQAYYCTPTGGKVMSYNRLIKEGKVSYYEFEVFEREGDDVVFRPFPGGKQATPLTLIECDPKARKAVFENPKKDFPTRIAYHRVAQDRLVITLSDPHNASDTVQTFDLKRK